MHKELAEEVGGRGTHAMPRSGDRLGRCLLVAPLGQGGTSDVWEGWHTTLAIPVAVKILRPGADPVQEVRMLGRFRHEALLASRLDHPGFVRVYDYGEDASRPYLVLELVGGTTLEEWMRSHVPVSEECALQILEEICRPLAVLHRLGMVHRDVKPSNIQRTADGRIKILDLGLAAFPKARGKDGVISGTLPYLAPECFSEDCSVDARADLYALGVVFHRLLTSRYPAPRGQATALPEGLDEATAYLLRWLLEPEVHWRVASASDVERCCREQRAWLGRRQRLSDQALEVPA